MSLIREEQVEEERHDRKYSKEDRDLYIAPHHWQKYDSIKVATHCHVHLVKSLGNINGKRVLDLGCGTGQFAVILAKLGALVDAMDISGVAIELAEKRANVNEVNDRITFQKMSVYDLAYPDNSFDLIVGLSILHHIRDKDRIVEPLSRILKPGGRILFREPFGNSSFLERLRLLVPVSVNEEDKTHWNEQIKYKDLDVFRRRFDVHFKEFQLFSRMDRVVKWSPFIKILGHIDLFMLEKLPFLRSYARDIVIELTRKKAFSSANLRNYID